MPAAIERHIARSTWVAVTIAASCSAAAESSAPETSSADLSEIVVTAGKRQEALQQAPLSILVARAEDLERGGVLDFENLPYVAPSLTISKTTQPANNSINIRGIGTYAFSIAVEPSVGVVIDDIPLAFQAAAFTSLVDVSQVEVLRGPQSTLFGKSSSAGVIKLTTAPVSQAVSGHVQALTTDDHERGLQATLSGPISADMGYRLSANYSDFRGTLYNLTTGHWLNGQSDVNLRGKLEWHPASGLSFSISPFWTRTVGTCCTAAETFVPNGATTGSAATGPTRIPTTDFLQGIIPGPDNRTLRMDVDARGDALHKGGGLRAEYRADALSLLSLSSYEGYTLYDRQDTDSTDINFARYQPASPPGGSANGGSFDGTALTQEFRLTSADEKRLQYVAGTFWSRTRSTREFVRGSNSLDDYSVATPPGVVVIPVVPANLPTTNSTSYSRYRARANADNVAVFGQGTVVLARTLDLLAGMRWEREEIGYSFVDQGHDVSYGLPHCSTQTPSGIRINTCNGDDAITGRVGLRLRPNPRLMLFATYTRGHKGMAYDLSSTLTLRSPAPASSAYAGMPLADVIAAKQPVPAEEVDDYEAGFKSTFLDGRVTLNVTAYHMAIENFQVQSRDLLLAQNVLNSVGHVTSRGVEAESSVRLGRLSLSAAVARGQAVIDVFPNASCYGGQTASAGCVSGVQNLAGQALPDAPRWATSIQGQYSRLISTGLEAIGTIAYRWQSAVNHSLLQDPAAGQPAYGVLNLAAGLRATSWKLTAFVNNVFNQSYSLNSGRDTYFNNPPGMFATSWRPGSDSLRETGVRVSCDF